MNTYLSTKVSDLEYGAGLHSAAGSFYTDFSDDKDFFRALCVALSKGHRETWISLDDLAKSFGIYDCPLYRRQRFFKWTISQSDKRGDVPDTIGSFVIGGGFIIGMSSGARVLYPAPSDLLDAVMIQDSITTPEVLLVFGVDVTIVSDAGQSWLAFPSDPFASDLFTIEASLTDDNEDDDQHIVLWLFHSIFSGKELFDKLWGYLFGVSSITDNVQKSVRYLMQAITGGPSRFLLTASAGRAFDCPVCETGGETVQYLFTDRNGQVVVTDQNAYRYPATAEMIVTAGDILQLGQPITSTIRWYDLSRVEIDDDTFDITDVPGLGVSQADLGVNYSAGLSFPNLDEPLQVTTQGSYTKVSVALGGTTADQDLFWNEVHSRGVAGGRTLAQFLDIRPNPQGEPTASDLPATLNPLQFLISQCLRYHAILGVIDWSQEPSALGVKVLAAWGNVMPSHQDIRVLSEITSTGGTMSLTSSAGTILMGTAMITAGGTYSMFSYQQAAGGYPITG